MLKVLIPVDDSRNCQFAAKEVIKQFMNNTAMEVHLLNVQRPFSRHISQFSSKASRQQYHDERAAQALRPIREMLNNFGIPHSVHVELGDKPKVIADVARRLHCDQIVISAVREHSLTRIFENAAINRVRELCSVPIEMVAGEPVSKWERYGVPTAIGTAVAAMLLAAAD